MLQPTRTTVNVMGQQQVLAIEEVTFGAVDPAVFELPDAIKGLVAAKEAEQKAAEAGEGDAAAPAAKDGGDATSDTPARRPRPRPRPQGTPPANAPATAPTP